jgi:O-antigen/teichoic acid export membrane protein
MLRFGVKSLTIRSPMLILVQTTNIIIVSHLGPASLAVFSRSLALVRHVESFISKFAFILAPTAGSLQGLGKEGELRNFFMENTRYGVAFSAPILFFLIFDGDLILRFWMGEQYVHGSILTILALGYFLPIAQNSVREILKGMNAHGRIGILSFCISIGCFFSGSILLKEIGWTMDGAAVLLAVSLTVGLGFAPPLYACRKLRVPYAQYLYRSILPPLLCNGVFIAALLAGRLVFPTNGPAAICVGGATGLFLLTFLYLIYVFPGKANTLWKSFQQKKNSLPSP